MRNVAVMQWILGEYETRLGWKQSKSPTKSSAEIIPLSTEITTQPVTSSVAIEEMKPWTRNATQVSNIVKSRTIISDDKWTLDWLFSGNSSWNSKEKLFGDDVDGEMRWNTPETGTEDTGVKKTVQIVADEVHTIWSMADFESIIIENWWHIHEHGAKDWLQIIWPYSEKEQAKVEEALWKVTISSREEGVTNLIDDTLCEWTVHFWFISREWRAETIEGVMDLKEVIEEPDEKIPEYCWSTTLEDIENQFK